MSRHTENKLLPTDSLHLPLCFLNLAMVGARPPLTQGTQGLIQVPCMNVGSQLWGPQFYLPGLYLLKAGVQGRAQH